MYAHKRRVRLFLNEDAVETLSSLFFLIFFTCQCFGKKLAFPRSIDCADLRGKCATAYVWRRGRPVIAASCCTRVRHGFRASRCISYRPKVEKSGFSVEYRGKKNVQRKLQYFVTKFKKNVWKFSVKKRKKNWRCFF